MNKPHWQVQGDWIKRGRLAMAGQPCPYCDVRMTKRNHRRTGVTRDHVLAKSKGGTAVLIVCYSCNNRKDDQDPTEWLKRFDGCQRTKVTIQMCWALWRELNK